MQGSNLLVNGFFRLRVLADLIDSMSSIHSEKTNSTPKYGNKKVLYINTFAKMR